MSDTISTSISLQVEKQLRKQIQTKLDKISKNKKSCPMMTFPKHDGQGDVLSTACSF